jgi:hypothetical protein
MIGASRRQLRVALALALVACGEAGSDRARQSPRRAALGKGARGGPARAPVLPPPDANDRLIEAHHLRWVSGDLAGARRLLVGIAMGSSAKSSQRAFAALRLAELAEASGDRRGALGHLDHAKALAGPGHALALEADDRRARILTATPLADVRGPIPGTVALKGETGAVVASFRSAEKLLASYHRIVLAPSLENVNEMLRGKRRALAAAVAAYQRIATSVGSGHRRGEAASGPAAQTASWFRIGAMYHHLAEALAFESPSELLPSVARRLTRQLRAESVGYLRRALASYRSALKVPRSGATAAWLDLARREADTLELVLKAPARRGASADSLRRGGPGRGFFGPVPEEGR